MNSEIYVPLDGKDRYVLGCHMTTCSCATFLFATIKEQELTCKTFVDLYWHKRIDVDNLHLLKHYCDTATTIAKGKKNGNALKEIEQLQDVIQKLEKYIQEVNND